MVRTVDVCADDAQMRREAVDVSVVIPVYDNRAALSRCLRSILRSPDPRYEVIVVDDGSPVDQRVLDDPRVRYVRLPRNSGPAAARNAGVRASAGSILLFTDSDCIAGPGWVQKGRAQLFEARAEHPDVAAVCGWLRHGTGFFERCHAHANYAYVQRGRRRVTSFANTSCQAMWRSAFEAVGGFDPDLRTHEDYDLALRLVERGYVIVFDPRVSVYHDRPVGSLRELLALHRRLGSAGGYRFEQKHPTRLGWIGPHMCRRGLAGGVCAVAIAGATTAKIVARNIARNPDVLAYAPFILGCKIVFRLSVRRAGQAEVHARSLDPTLAADWKIQNRVYHEDPAVVATYDRRLLRKFAVEQTLYTTRPWSARIADTSAVPVLDVGCGPGTMTLPLLQQAVPTVSLDISQAMLVSLRTKARAVDAHGIYAQGDIERLPFPDGSFGAVVCTGVLHHLVDPAAAVSEMIRVVRPGGLVFIAEPCRERPWPSFAYGAAIAGLTPFLRPFRGVPSCCAERPLSASEIDRVTGVFVAHEVNYAARYLVYWPYVNELIGPRLAQRLTAAVNRIPKRSRRGDVVNIVAEKPMAAVDRQTTRNEEDGRVR